MEPQHSNVFEDEVPYYEPAPTGLRFANYIVDMILYYLVFFAVIFLFGILVAVVQADSGEDPSAFLESGTGTLIIYLIAFAVLLLFFTLMEGITRGRSLGKLITGTVAVREDGTTITWKDALMRSLCRIIPFEALSGLSGRPWHDSMTKTIVIRK